MLRMVTEIIKYTVVCKSGGEESCSSCIILSNEEKKMRNIAPSSVHLPLAINPFGRVNGKADVEVPSLVKCYFVCSVIFLLLFIYF